jgi:spermidine synthase
MSGRWVTETWPNVEVRYKVKDELHDSKTPFQSMELVETYHYGKMLLLDGVVQTTEHDEFVYHEMMTHVPLFSHSCPKSVLIIGGGDGGILRETLKHECVNRAVMVEIDESVVEFSKKHLPTISSGAFDDPRAELVIADGAEYIDKSPEKFDVIIVDSPDPVGPAKVLFCEEFYKNLSTHLSDGGIISKQSGSTFMQPDELRESCDTAKKFFKYVTPSLFNVPTYIGGLFCSLYASNSTDPFKFNMDNVQGRFKAMEKGMKYYNPGVHFGSFQLPGYVKEIING